MEVLGGEVVLEVDGFVVVLEAEFTCVLVKVKGLGGAAQPLHDSHKANVY